MHIEFFAESLAEICSRSAVTDANGLSAKGRMSAKSRMSAKGRPLRWIIIANPTAGGFTIPSRWKKNRKDLEAGKIAAQENPLLKNCSPAKTAEEFSKNPVLAKNGLVQTEGPGYAAKITASIIKEISTDDKNSFYLIITAGGDGTSLEVLSVLYQTSAEIRSNLAVIRLPLGTGNDGADANNLASALDLLIKPTCIKMMPALQLVTSPEGPAVKKSPYLAFNILSVGLDAFVTHMTNKMKGKLPGDFYKLWVDISSLLYDRLYKVDILDVKVTDRQSGEEKLLNEKILLLAVGASGHRTYGSQKKILPDDRNVCAVKQMSLFRKIDLKGLFTTGAHVDEPESILFNAHRVEITGKYPILAQMDGESVLLKPEDFPVAIELTEPVIPVLKLI